MSDPLTNRRQFAMWVVRKLRNAGFEALWAGGCVRDELLGRTPSDFDVATSATPDHVRRCFGFRRTLAIGAAFGVITVRGRRDQGQVEVATFRCDAAYSDGRHPDHVTFSSAKEDALRRDFTMNGLFFDPLGDEVIDYVGGRQDLADGVVRAIGNPFARFAEDKLRMLRAVRFTTTFGFCIDPDTMAAIQQEADNVRVVSAERIAAELRKLLVHPRRAEGVRLLRESGLLDVILPESRALFDQLASKQPGDRQLPAQRGMEQEVSPLWSHTLGILDRLKGATFRVALSGLLWGIQRQAVDRQRIVDNICQRWKLSNHEQQGTAWLLAHESDIRRASVMPWGQLQRILIQPAAEELLILAEAVAGQLGENLSDVAMCRAQLQLPPSQLNPAPLITGDDLRQAGLSAGPLYGKLLEAVRDAQLEGQIATREEAMDLALRLARQSPGNDREE